MPDPQDDLFLQRRLLLASVLSALALMFYLYVAGPATPPPAEDPAAAVAEEPVSEPAAEAPETPAEEPSAPKPQAEGGEITKVAESEQQTVVETDSYVVSFSNRGAVVTSWILKDYKDAKGDSLNLVHPQGAKEYGYPFALALPGGEPLKELNDALFVAEQDPPGGAVPVTVTFEYGQGGWQAKKSFRFAKEGYVVGVETELRENGAARPHLITWNSAFGDTAQLQDSLYSTTFYYDLAARELVRNKAADAEESRIVNSGSYLYAGIDDLFFTAAFLPPDPQEPLRLETAAVQIEATAGAGKEVFAALAVGGAPANRLDLFLGPKSIDVLDDVRSELREIVDFGFFGFVAEPIFWMLRWTHEHVVANYGWSIVVVTVFINFVLFPLKWKSMKSMKRMQALQPLVKQINEKYKGLSMRDPKKAQQNEEMMALYKKHRVNPMGGCLPILLQLPFFIGFYNVLTVAIEMRHASWLWVSDLSTYEQLPVRILPLAMVVTQFWQQSMTPTPSTDPAQTRLMKFMPLLMGFIFYGFSSGLVLFWLTSNVVGVVQQAILNRFSSDEVLIEKPRARRKKKRKAGS